LVEETTTLRICDAYKTIDLSFCGGIYGFLFDMPANRGIATVFRLAAGGHLTERERAERSGLSRTALNDIVLLRGVARSLRSPSGACVFISVLKRWRRRCVSQTRNFGVCLMLDA
jgi:hypothetical protein